MSEQPVTTPPTINHEYLKTLAKGNENVQQALQSLSKTTLKFFFDKSNTTVEANSTDTKGAIDLEYAQYIEVWSLLCVWSLNSSDSIANSVVALQQKGREYDTITAIEVMAAINTLRDDIWELKKAKFWQLPYKERPRIVRAAEKLKLTTPEQKMFENIFHTSLTSGGTMPASLVANLGVTWNEVATFMHPSRDHIKHTLFEYADFTRLFQSALQFPSEIIAAFLGSTLSAEQLLKLDNTVVAEVLAEDGEEGLMNKDDVSVKSEEGLPVDEEPKYDFGEEITPKDDNEESTPEEKEVEAEKENEDEDEVDTVDDFHNFLKRQIAAEKDLAKPTTVAKDGDEDKITAYTSDLDYLEAEAKKIFYQFKTSNSKQEAAQSKQHGYDSHQQEVRLREISAQLRVAEKKCAKRLELTKQAGEWRPRMERLIAARSLDDFERYVLLALVAAHISSEMHSLGYSRALPVGDLLRVYSASFEVQVRHRSYFYKNAKIIKEGIIRISGGSALDDDLIQAYVHVDRRMLEFVMGLDTEFSELVEGSHLYFPKVALDQVVLTDEVKKLILATVSNFEGFKKAMKKSGFDDSLTYGQGITMLFYGASGTGKTMMANAIANHVNKRVLLINFPSLGNMDSGENLKFVFREAKINDAILFFDECESLFESREHGNRWVNLLLTEIERHDGLIIMATNRAYDLDEAMHRRITLAIEFHKPDPILRENIWRNNIPKSMPLAKDIDLKSLAMSFELTGGFIKNAILSALSIAVTRDGEKDVLVKQEDFEAGARLQLRGRLRMLNFEHRVVPKHGLESLILPAAKLKILQDVVNFEKARQILVGQWGFDKVLGQDKANSVLFWGPPGTGKTLAAEAISFSSGKPLKMVNMGQLTSKYVGETSKNISHVFDDATANDAVLVFDEAESLFGTRTTTATSTDRYANLDVGLLLYHIEHYPGIVVLCTNLIREIDPAFFRRIKFVVEFNIPDSTARASLWRKLIPKECPIHSSVDFTKLGNLHEFTGGQIKSAIVRAATRAALRSGDTHCITQEDLEISGTEEANKLDSKPVGTSLYV